MGALAIGSVIISPHANFYDAAVLAIGAAAILAAASRDNAPLKILAIGWLAFLPFPIIADLPASPLAIVMWIAFVAMVISTVSPKSPVSEASIPGQGTTERQAAANA